MATSIENKIAELEARIAKLEAALASGAKPKSDKVPEDYEQIIKEKWTNSTWYYLTNKGRVLKKDKSVTPLKYDSTYNRNEARYTDQSETKLKPEWLRAFKANLLAIGDQDLLKGDSVEDVMDCTEALRAKYRATATLPCLLPNMSVVITNGEMMAFKESARSIKF